jgi:hypothetical protein
VVDLAKTRGNVTVVELNTARNDEVYWDTVHYRVQHASEIIDAIGSAVEDGRNSGPFFDVLWPRPPGLD